MARVEVDRTTYDKSVVCKPWLVNGRVVYRGWWPRGPRTPQPTRILIHTTNGQRGTSFKAEAKFLQTSHDVGAHYLVGKQGQVVRFLKPVVAVAWHTGVTIPGWGNPFTIGIEQHFTPGEDRSAAMVDALERLILDLAVIYPIGDFRTHIETHRRVALPAGRKIDPSNFDDDEFRAWRERLQAQRVAG